MIQIVVPLSLRHLSSEPLRTLFNARQELYPVPRSRPSYPVLEDSPPPSSPSPPAVANSQSTEPRAGSFQDRPYQHYTPAGYINAPPPFQPSTPTDAGDDNDNVSMVSTMDLQYPESEEEGEANVIDVSVPVLLVVYFHVSLYGFSSLTTISTRDFPG